MARAKAAPAAEQPQEVPAVAVGANIEVDSDPGAAFFNRLHAAGIPVMVTKPLRQSFFRNIDTWRTTHRGWMRRIIKLINEDKEIAAAMLKAGPRIKRVAALEEIRRKLIYREISK